MSNDPTIPQIAKPTEFSPCVTCRHWYCANEDRTAIGKEAIGKPGHRLKATLREDGSLFDEAGRSYGSVDGWCRLSPTSVPKPSDDSCSNHSRVLSDAAYWLMEIYNLLSQRR